MNPHLYMNKSLDGAPAAELNNLTLDDGRLLVSVYLDGGIGGPRIAFEDPAQIEPWLLAFDDALKLLRQGQAELDKRLAGKQAKEAAEAEYRAGNGLDHADPGDDPTSLDEDPPGRKQVAS